MQKGLKVKIAKVCAIALTMSVIGSVMPVSGASAAAKPKLSKSKLSITVGKKKKITVKKAKPKKTTWKLNKAGKKVVSLSKKSKKSVTVKGKKPGKATLTAKIKVGKKSYRRKVKIKVSAKSTSKDKKTSPATTVPVTTAPATKAPDKQSPDTNSPAVSPGDDTPTADTSLEPTPSPFYTEDFENGLGEWFARYNPEQNEAKLEITTEAHEGTGAAVISGRDNHAWNSPGIDMIEKLVPGATYKVRLWAKVPNNDTAYDYTKGLNLRVSAAYQTTEDAETVYCNYPADTNYKVFQTDWTLIETEFTVPDTIYSYVFYIESNGKGKASFIIDDVSFTTISLPGTFDPSLDSIKDTYQPYVETMGVAVSYPELLNQNTLGFIKHHFNSVTAGNEMKLDDTLGSKETVKLDEASSDYVVSDAYKACPDNQDAEGNVIVPVINFNKLDAYLKSAKENGLKARIHSPFWHQQNPGFFFTKKYEVIDDKKAEKDNGELYDTVDPSKYTDADTMYTREDMYVRTLLNHICNSEYGDVVYAYDVVNEYLNMKNEGEYTNHWSYIFGTEVQTDSQYVKQAYASAYEELKKHDRTDMSLLYNDYNTYDQPDKVVELINNINAADALNPDGEKICAGIGMQSHINDKGTTAEKYEDALKKFKEAGFEIQITELDVTCTGEVKSDTPADKKEQVWAANGKLYGELMTAILNQKAAGANITSITLWGTTDAGSWRPEKAPLLFGESLADKKPSFDAFINAAKNIQATN